MKINNIAIVVYLKLDAYENMYVSVTFRLSLADIYRCSLVLF